jgi:hypothetical protein
MSAQLKPATEIKPKRYIRSPRVVNVRELSEDNYLVTDLNDQKDYEYVISKAVLDREFKEIDGGNSGS